MKMGDASETFGNDDGVPQLDEELDYVLDEPEEEEEEHDEAHRGGRNWLWHLNKGLQERISAQQAADEYDEDEEHLDSYGNAALVTWLNIAFWNSNNAYREASVANLAVRDRIDLLAVQEPIMQTGDASDRMKWINKGRTYLREHGYEQIIEPHQIITCDQERLEFARQEPAKIYYDGRVIVNKFRIENGSLLVIIAVYNVARGSHKLNDGTDRAALTKAVQDTVIREASKALVLQLTEQDFQTIHKIWEWRYHGDGPVNPLQDKKGWSLLHTKKLEWKDCEFENQDTFLWNAHTHTHTVPCVCVVKHV